MLRIFFFYFSYLTWLSKDIKVLYDRVNDLEAKMEHIEHLLKGKS